MGDIGSPTHPHSHVLSIKTWEVGSFFREEAKKKDEWRIKEKRKKKQKGKKLEKEEEKRGKKRVPTKMANTGHFCSCSTPLRLGVGVHT